MTDADPFSAVLGNQRGGDVQPGSSPTAASRFDQDKKSLTERLHELAVALNAIEPGPIVEAEILEALAQVDGGTIDATELVVAPQPSEGAADESQRAFGLTLTPEDGSEPARAVGFLVQSQDGAWHLFLPEPVDMPPVVTVTTP